MPIFRSEILLILLLSLFSQSSLAQTKRTDSLKALLKKDLQDTTRINAINNLAVEIWKTNDFDGGKKMAMSALKESEKLGYAKGRIRAYDILGGIQEAVTNYDSSLYFFRKSLSVATAAMDQDGIAIAFKKISYVHYHKTAYDSSLFYNQKTLDIRTRQNDQVGISACYNLMGEIARVKGEYDKALEHHLKALRIRETIKDRRNMALSYNNIGIIYYYQGNYDKCLEYYQKALRIREDFVKEGSALAEKDVAATLNNIALIYNEQKEYKKAIDYYERSLEIFERNKDESPLSSLYTNVGVLYQNMGNNVKSMEYLLKGLHFAERANDKITIASVLINISSICDKQGNSDQAIAYLQRSQKLSEEIGSNENLLKVYTGFADVYANRKDYKNAFFFQNKYTVLKDRTLSEESSKRIVEMSVKYETEKKDKEIQLLNKDKNLKEVQIEKQRVEAEKQTVQRNALFLGLLLVAALAIFIFRGYRNKQKANEIIAAQKVEVEKQKELVEEKQKEVLDSIQYAKRIQESLLPTERYIEKNLKRLNKK